MAFGGFSKGGEGAPMAEINMIPLIDVMLVLLVMLILTLPVQNHAVKLEMPPPSSNVPLENPERINIEIDQQLIARAIDGWWGGVGGGFWQAASGQSSNPIMAISSGILNPAFRMVSMAPMAPASFGPSSSTSRA